MNYKLLFEMEVEKNKQVAETLNWYRDEYERLKFFIKFQNKKIEDLESQIKGEVEPKLQPTIIINNYI